MLENNRDYKGAAVGFVLNSKGSALLNAIMFSGLMLAASGVMMYQSLQTQRLSRMPRVASEMDRIQARVREIALDPNTYSGCKTIGSDSADSSNTCTINTSLMTDLDARIAGCHKADSSNCGIKITDVSLDNSTGTFNATITYEGSEMPIKPAKVVMQIPKDVLQADVVSCPIAKPLFQGFDSKGKLICKAIKDASLCDLPGQYIKEINSQDFSVKACSRLKNTPLSCASDQYVSQFFWNGGVDANVVCAARKDPWVLMNYTPVTKTGAAKDNGFLPLAGLRGPTTPSVSCVDIPVVPPVPSDPGPSSSPSVPVVTSPSVSPSGPICVDVWTPDVSTQCVGTSFTQYSTCGGSKTAGGAKDCSVTGSSPIASASPSPTCIDIWQPDPSGTCSDATLTQTSQCGNSQTVSGTKTCVAKPADCGADAVTEVPNCNTGDPSTVVTPCGAGQVPACNYTFKSCGPLTDSVSRIYYNSCFCRDEPACK